jgi:elongation factor Ts
VAIDPEAVKKLREMTGAGMLDCKKALEEAHGDFEKAKDILRAKGHEAATKRAERETVEGIVAAYLHHNGRYGALVELNCESDFVARTDDFTKLAQDIALHVAAANPSYLSEEEIPEGAEGRPEDLALLSQPFVRDESVTILDMVNEAISKTGENIRIRRFARFGLGS